jgi:hypothetical protein
VPVGILREREKIVFEHSTIILITALLLLTHIIII